MTRDLNGIGARMKEGTRHIAASDQLLRRLEPEERDGIASGGGKGESSFGYVGGEKGKKYAFRSKDEKRH